jgi:TP901 family phage tail tape measure protein
MSGNLGNATLSLDVDDSRLIGGLNKALALVKAMGAQMASAYGQSGTAAGQAFGNNIQIVIGKATPGIGQAGNKAGQAYIGGMATAIQAGTGKVTGGVQTVLQPTVGSAAAAGLKAGAAMAASMARGLGNGAGAISGVGQSIGAGIRSHFGDIGKGIGYSIGSSIQRSVSAGLGAALNTENIAAFDKASLKVAQLTKDQKGMELAARSLSKELRYGATSADILKAGYETLSSGISGTANVSNILRAAIKASVASGGDATVARTNDAITSIINSYKRWGYTARDAGAIINQVSGTVDAGKISYAEYAQQIGKAASLAGASGVSFLEMNTAIAQATITGQRPEAVLSGMPGLIANIISPTKDAKKAYKELGVEFGAAALQSKGLLRYLKDIGDARTKSGKSGKSGEMITRLFGSIRGRNIATAVIQNPQNTEAIKAQVAAGNTDKNFDLATRGIAFKQEAFKRRVIELDVQVKQGAIGNALGSAFGMATQAIDAVVAGLENLSKVYASLSPQQKSIVDTLGGVAIVAAGVSAVLIGIGVVVGLLGGAVGAAVVAIGGMVAGLASLAVAAAPIAVPFLAAGAAVYALAKYLGESDFEAFRSAVIAVGGAMAAVFGGGAVTAMLAGLQSIILSAIPVAAPILAIGAAIYALLKALGATDTEAFQSAMIAAGSTVALVFGPAAISALVAGVSAFVTGFAAIAVAAAAAIIPLLPWIALAAGIAAAIYLLYKAFTGGIPIINQWGREMASQWQVLSGRAAFEFDKIKLSISESMKAAGVVFGQVASNIGKFFRYMTIGIFEDTAKLIANFFLGQEGARALGDTFNGLWKGAAGAFNGMVNEGRKMIDWFGQGFNNLVNQIKGVIDWFQKLPSSIPGMGGNEPKPNYNWTPPKKMGPNRGDQSSAGTGVLVAYADNGVVSDSPQGLIAGNPGYTVSGGGKHHGNRGGQSAYREEGGETYLYNAGGVRRLVKDVVLSINGRTDVGIPSPASGTARVGYDERGYGHFVEVLNEVGNRIAIAAHLSKVSVTSGDLIKFGDILGTQGYSGRVSPPGPRGTHGHLEMPPENWAPYMKGLRSGAFSQEPSMGTGIGSGRTSKEITEERARLEIEDAQKDLDRTQRRLDAIKNAGVARQTYSSKGKPTGLNATKRQAAYDKKVEAAEHAVTKAQKRLKDAQLRLENADNNVEKERKQKEIDALKNRIDEINSRYDSKAKLIDEMVSADPSKKDLGTQQKADLLVSQGKELTALFPELQALGRKYPDNATVSDLRTKVNEIIGKRIEARAAKAEADRLPLSEIDRRVAEAIAKNQADGKASDYAASTGLITTDQNAAEKSKALTEMSNELDLLLPQLQEMGARFKDPETVARIRAITAAIQDQRIEAERMSKELTTSQYKVLIDKTLATADREQQAIKNQRSLGNIATDLEMEKQLLAVRLKTADALDLLKPKLEALAAIQKDPAVKLAIEDQILGIQTYGAEVVDARDKQVKAQTEATAAYQLTKEASLAVVDASREAFADLFRGAKNLGSILDNLINKIADIAVNTIFDAFLKPGIMGLFGFAHGTRSVGTIPNFANGIADALARERAQSGKRPFLAALHEGEAVLSTLNGDSQLYNQMLRDGRWAMAKSTPNYANGTASAVMSRPSSGVSSTNRIVVDRINKIDYVTLEQVQQIMAVESPLTVEASLQGQDQRLRGAGYRKRMGIR